MDQYYIFQKDQFNALRVVTEYIFIDFFILGGGLREALVGCCEASICIMLSICLALPLFSIRSMRCRWPTLT